MILSLKMRNIALISQLTLEFHQGMHVMTGETGAGKSIVVDAVNLVLGGRADKGLIRTGEDKAMVEAVFDDEGSRDTAKFLEENQIECDGFITLSREITRSGKNLCRVCGTVVPVVKLKEIADLLMDVHGQHEGQFLMDPKFHLQFLDFSGGEEHLALRQQVEESYENFIAVHREYARLHKENQQKEYRVAWLKDAVEELKKARIRKGEEEKLSAEKEKFRHSEKISSCLTQAHTAFSGDEMNQGLLIQLNDAREALRTLSSFDEKFAAAAESCDSAYFELQEISYDVNKMLDEGEFDPERRDQVESRLDQMKRLERKYSADSGDELVEKLRELEEELSNFASMDSRLERLAQKHKQLLSLYRRASAQLSESRKRLAEEFSRNMMQQLKDLGMGNTVFSVEMTAPAGDIRRQMPQPTGDDTVQFLISPNPGEPLKPLSRIASGGELSRLMLAIKSLEAEHSGVGCMVFDEIDTGISGRTAQVVAEKMKAIAKKRQVICVTHLPQIAAMADHQFLVEKQVEGDRTNTTVRELTPDERVDEVARMLGGASGTDESARNHASHMIEDAKQI